MLNRPGVFYVLELDGNLNAPERINPEYTPKGISPGDTPKIQPSMSTQVGGNHYAKLGIQPGEYAMANKLNYWQGNAIKYVTRYRDKGGRQDLEKAIDCIQKLMETEYGLLPRDIPKARHEP